MSDTTQDGAPLAKISGEFVRIYKEHFGRGPRRVRTEWAGEDVITSVVEYTLTPVERRLRDLGQSRHLHENRLLYQQVSRDDFIDPVERHTGRRVRAFVSGIDPVEDVSIETFVLYPRTMD